MSLRILLFTAIILFCLPSYSNFSNDDHGKIDLYLYFWPASMNGNITADSHTTDTSIKFNDILRTLKMEANGAIKISQGDWFLFNDFIYLNIAPKASKNISPSIIVNTTLDAITLTNMLAVGHQWQNSVSWSFFVGARYVYSKMQLDATIESTASLQAVKSKKWITPAIGVGIELPLNDKLFFNVVTDIGAISKSFNWTALPTFCWRFNKMFTAELGYRLLSIKYKEDNLRINTTMHGPMIGLKVSL